MIKVLNIDGCKGSKQCSPGIVACFRHSLWVTLTDSKHYNVVIGPSRLTLTIIPQPQPQGSSVNCVRMFVKISLFLAKGEKSQRKSHLITVLQWKLHTFAWLLFFFSLKGVVMANIPSLLIPLYQFILSRIHRWIFEGAITKSLAKVFVWFFQK